MDGKLDCPLGPMLFCEQNGFITALRFLSEGESGSFPSVPASELARKTADWLRRYCAGENPAPDLPLAPAGTAFQRRVWQAAAEIPYGETRSYGQIAAAVGCRSARAVGAALGKNPIWILIPCHRVIGADGSLTGYAGGIEIKRALLELERKKDTPLE